MTEAIDLGIDGIADAEPLNAGGNAIVYRARQPAMDRDVVVKILRAANDPAVKRRFAREQKAMGRLSQHRGIVPVYQSGLTTRNDPYLVMPYYQRGSLEDELASNGRFDPEHARQDLIAICDALQVAHDNGVLHRDIKPGNILRSDEGRPIVTDFGIASMMDNAQSVSTALTMTPLYSPPEVFEGAKPAVGHDVYGLGAVLFALLNGKPAYDRGDVDSSVLALMRRVTEHPLPDLPDDVPPGVVAALRRAMAKKPAERFASVAEFGDALRAAPDFVAPAVLPRRTINSRPVSPTNGANPSGYTAVIRPLTEPAKKSSKWPLGMAAVALLIAGAVALYLLIPDGGDDGTSVESIESTEQASSAGLPEVDTPAAALVAEGLDPTEPVIDLARVSAGLTQAVAQIEGAACGSVLLTNGVLLGDNRVLVPMRYGRSAWLTEVRSPTVATSLVVDDVLVWPEIAMLRLLEDVGPYEPPDSISVGSQVFVAEPFSIAAGSARPRAASVVALDQLAGRVSVAEPFDPGEVNSMIQSPIVDRTGAVVAMVTDVLSGTEFSVAFDPTLVIRDPVVAGAPPDLSCPPSGGELFVPGSPDYVLESSQVATFVLAQELADAFASGDWAKARLLEPGKEFYDNDLFEVGWGLLETLTLYPISARELSDGVWDWRVGIVGHERHDGEPVTVVFCNNWQSDINTNTVSQSPTDSVVIVGPDAPNPGWVDPLAYVSVFAEAGC